MRRCCWAAAPLLLATPGARGDCAAALQRLCGATRGGGSPCLTCIIANGDELSAAGCTPDEEENYCAPTPAPTPAPPLPPPASKCVKWVLCDSREWEDDCPKQFVNAGHQCQQIGTSVDRCSPGQDGTPETICLPATALGPAEWRAGHDNIGDGGGGTTVGNGGCIYADGTSPPRVYNSWRATPPAGGPALRWVLTRAGYKSPPGALRSGTTPGGNEAVVARTLTAGTNHGNVIPGWVEVAGGILGELVFNDYDQGPTHPGNDYNTTDYELACCGDDSDCTPQPPQPPHYTHPWVRFAHTVPANHNVDCVVELGNQTKEWSNYNFGHFSDWAGHFNAGAGNGKVTIYENVGGKRGAVLVQAQRFLPPGPVLIALKGGWPPANDTQAALGSIEAIANSFTKPPGGRAEVRLFNLGPDSAKASLARDGASTASGVAFTLGSDWAEMPASAANFTITDSASGAELATLDTTPPVGASSIFLIGLQDESAPAVVRTQAVFLVDNPQ